MRILKTNSFGEVVDLDDETIYSHLPSDTKSLRNLMLQEIGFYHCYTSYWHKDIFKSDTSKQMERIDKLIKNFTENERENYDNVRWYKEQVYLFQDECENMC